MGRFDRDNNTAGADGGPEVTPEGGHLPETLGVATEELRSTIEVEVARIVSDAKARATVIEDRALEKATQVEQDSERRLGAALAESRARLTALLAQIDAVETSLDDSLRTLRTRTHELTAGLAAAAAEPFAPPPPPPAEEKVETPPEEEKPAPVVEGEKPETPAAAEPQGEASDGGERPDPEIREMIREQLVTLAEVGRTRADAKRMLLRFRQGERYLDLLDEIYPEDAEAGTGRRSLFRRRKAES